MTEQERRVLLEHCAHGFRDEHELLGEYIPEPLGDRAPLKAESRTWLSVRLTKFNLSHNPNGEAMWVAFVYGQRSDGRLFQVTVPFPEKFEFPGADRVASVQAKLANAWYTFDTFRDCSCGIIGYELTDEVDSEGDRIGHLIHSPCDLHSKGPAVESKLEGEFK